MRFKRHQRIRRAVAGFCFLVAALSTRPTRAEVIRVATYNVENYLDAPTSTRHAKSPLAEAKVAESIVALKPDVIALEEMGSTNALMGLQARLKSSGVDLPYWDEIHAYDTNIHIAVLSRFPLREIHAHTNESFVLDGRSLPIRRGFAELQVAVRTNSTFTLFAAHLKSKVPTPEADEEEWRYQEALALRKIVDQRLAANPDEPIVVLGDFNDLTDSKPIRAIIGRGKTALFDTRPAERANDTDEKRRVVWTDYYAKEDSYTRIDYIFCSRAMKKYWRREETYILNLPGWGLASDHRPLVAGFDLPGP